MIPERRAGGEVRVSGRTLSGTAMPYGTVSPDFRERFEPGAFGEVRAVDLNLQHDPAVVVARGASLTDSPVALSVRATLPDGAAALALVKRGALRGFSVEFTPTRERRDAAGVRVVEAATLTGLALVDRPAYPAAGAEVRARSGRTMRAELPSNRRMACECLGKDACGVEFPDDVLEAGLEEAFGRHARGEGDLIAVAGDYSRAIGSVSRGTVRRTGNVVEIDLPDTDGARALLGAHEAAGTIIRPVIDKANSEFEAVDGLAKFVKLRIRALVIGSTDATAGWPEPDLIPTPGWTGGRRRWRGGYGCSGGALPVAGHGGAGGGCRAAKGRGSWPDDGL